MSEVRVNNIVDYGGKGAPTFDNGAVISGVSSLGSQAKIGSNVTITSGGINVSGVTTAATLSGNLTGDVNSGFVTATSAIIGSGVTINATGLNITGVVTATTFEGSGANMTGVAMTIAPLAYNPDVNDTQVTVGTGIGITFDHRILAGSGNVTLSVSNAGAAGTTVENFGVGSSVTIAGRKAIITPSDNLSAGETYHISYPSGAFTNTGGDISYVGTAYTFGVKPEFGGLYTFGDNELGQLGQNSTVNRSSPVQIPGTRWKNAISTPDQARSWLIGTNDGTLWAVGRNTAGQLGQNNDTVYSSPIQIPGTNWSGVLGSGHNCFFATKTDGTLWAWGWNDDGQLMQNNQVSYSSPVQIGSDTDWSTDNLNALTMGYQNFMGIKSDGTLWGGGANTFGARGTNQASTHKNSSPVQVGSDTTWAGVWGHPLTRLAVKTDGTAWAWGHNSAGQLGLNNTTNYSSPTQIGSGSDWSYMSSSSYNDPSHGIKTDGTLWAWGGQGWGQLGLNQGGTVRYSSPVQVPGTTWRQIAGGEFGAIGATKTDGTLWMWGQNHSPPSGGTLGQNNHTDYSSPVQVPGTTWRRVKVSDAATYAFTEE